MAKYRITRELLAADGRFSFAEAPLVPAETLALAHDSAYVEAFLAGTLEAAMMRRIGFPWSEALVRRTLASVGGTAAAACDALVYGFGGTLAGGTHHASRSEGAGFCVFNDIAVAVVDLRRRAKVRRAAIVDLDVHQGDGTALIFAADPDVLTLSIHSENNFPFHKQRSRIDVPLPDRTGDQEYLETLADSLRGVYAFEPEIVFYQSGVDPLAGDRLGRLALTHAGLKERDRVVMKGCRDRSIPIVVTLGGGYADPIELTAEAHANTFRAAAEVFA